MKEIVPQLQAHLDTGYDDALLVLADNPARRHATGLHRSR